MHKLYALNNIGDKQYISKLTVEEYKNSNDTDKRFYNLKEIKLSSALGGLSENNTASTMRISDDSYTVSQLFNFVKTFDKNFSPREAFLTVAEKAAHEDLESFLGGAIAGGFMTAGNLGVQTAQVGGVRNMNQVLEYQSELSKLPEEEREKIIKQNEERYNKERAVEILTRDNINMGDIAGALNFLGVSDPQQAAKDIERFKETGETSDLMKDKNVSSVVEVLAAEGYFKKNEAVQVSDVKNPGETSETPTAQASDSSITQQTKNVKSDSNVREWKAEEAPPINVKADPMHGVNEDAVKVITDGIGSEGRKAYYNVLERESESSYQGSEATLLRDFNRFYIKGLNGGKLSEVSGKYAKVMTERSMTEAFKAGQSDRGAMLKEKFKAANNAVIRDGGLIRNVNSENMTNEDISQIDNLGKKFGVSIEIQDHVYNSSDKEVNGVYEAGRIILNQSKMEEFGNVKAAEGFLVKHELTHRVRELAPKGFETLKSVVYDIEDRKSGNTSKAETVMTQRGVDVDTAIEEIVADHMGNDDFALEVAMKDLSLAERIKGWVSDILDRVGIKKYSETQRIKRLWEKACAEAKRTVKNADKRVGNDVKIAGNAKYSDKMDFKHQVDASLDGKLQRGLSIYVGKTPNLLQKCGLDDLVMLINQAHLKNITAEKDSDNHKHGLTREQIKQLPNELKYPVMVYDSISETNKNCICVVTSLKDVDNLPIIAVIKANSNETNKYLDISLKTITTKDSNYILSAYGRANFENHLNEVINKNAVLYVNKEKTSKLISDSGLQLPTRYNSLRFDTIIHQSNNIVNTSGQNNQKNSDSDLSVTIEDIQAVQSVGRKSINDFTSEDIKKTESFARKY